MAAQTMAVATSQECASNYAYSSAKVFAGVFLVLKSVFIPWWLLLASMHSSSSSNWFNSMGYMLIWRKKSTDLKQSIALD